MRGREERKEKREEKEEGVVDLCKCGRCALLKMLWVCYARAVRHRCFFNLMWRIMYVSPPPSLFPPSLFSGAVCGARGAAQGSHRRRGVRCGGVSGDAGGGLSGGHRQHRPRAHLCDPRSGVLHRSVTARLHSTYFYRILYVRLYSIGSYTP